MTDNRILHSYNYKPKHKQHALVFYDVEVEQIGGTITMWSAAVRLAGQWLETIGHLNYRLKDHDIPIFIGYTKTAFYQLLDDIECKVLYLMAFNGHGYDHPLMFNGFKFKEARFNVGHSRIQTLELLYHGKLLVCKDIGSYITYVSLKSVGESLNCPKLDVDTQEAKELNIEYCARDTTIICLAWERIIETQYQPMVGVILHDINDIVYFTSQAQLSYLFMVHDLNLWLMPPDLYPYGQEAYYGAKVDSMIYGCIYNGEVACYDIHSMYPAAMNNLLPHGKCTLSTLPRIDWDNFKATRYKPFICTVTLSKLKCTDFYDMGCGILPIKDGFQTIYASCGVVTGVYTSVDIENALRDGWTVTKAVGFMVWEGWSRAIGDRYKYWYDIKQSHTKDSVLYWFAKQVLNASIGFLASSNTKPSYLNWFAMSYARRQLLLLKQAFQALKVSLHFYGDTDSIIISKEDADRLALNYPQYFTDQLGGGNLVTGEIEARDTGIIVRAKKLFCTGTGKKMSAKGYNKRQLNYEAFKKRGHTTHNHPICHVWTRGDTFYGTVSVFVDTVRRYNIVMPVYKQRLTNNVCINKFIKTL